MNALLGMLAFLSIFHVIGGIAVGGFFRQLLRRQFTCNSLFLLVWGAMFGLLPFLLGYGVFSQHGDFLFFGLEAGLFVGTILIVVLVPAWFLESFEARTLGPVAFGGLFVVIGIVVTIALIPQDLFMALVFLLAFGGIGGLVFVSGVRAALKR